MEKMMQANKSLRDARAQAHEKELVSAPDTACYKLHTICSSVHTHVHRVHYQTTLSCSTASLFSAHEKELADLEKCAQERVALDAVAAARKALEAKRFIERQAIRQAMIERATAELLQRTTDTDNREEREALQQRAKADAEDDRRADIRRTEKAAIDASRAHAAAVKAAEARAAREQDQKIKEFYLRRVTEVANQEVEEAAEQLRRNMDVRASQEQQRLEAKQRRDEDAALKAKQHQRMTAVKDLERERFERVVNAEIQQLQAEGRSTYLLQRVLHDTKGSREALQ
eukprot:4292-Heterococcus_DN1.PRE.1